ncbi:hypothetical protein ABIC85_000036 [Oerskovia enterophila]
MDPMGYSSDCAASRHRACSGDAWNYTIDQPTGCAHRCHQEDQ